MIGRFPAVLNFNRSLLKLNRFSLIIEPVTCWHRRLVFVHESPGIFHRLLYRGLAIIYAEALGKTSTGYILVHLNHFICN